MPLTYANFHDNICVGDLVKLRGDDSPPMIVKSIRPDDCAICIWTFDDAILQAGFNVAMLERVVGTSDFVMTLS
jgi:hypothetical protein